MSLREIFRLTIKCSNCGEIHRITVDELNKKNSIFCKCGKTIVVQNAKQVAEKIDELERLGRQAGITFQIEKKNKKKG